jgi:hypothetical protein
MKIVQKVLSLLIAHRVTEGLTYFIDKAFSASKRFLVTLKETSTQAFI